MELTLGPILFDWKRDEVRRFYEKAASMDVDRVYIGEVVCARKLGLSFDDLGGIIGELKAAGKKVVLSSLAVISNDDELEFTRRLLEFQVPVEANDMGVFNMADPRSREISAGPHITAYNAPTIEFLQSIGVGRVTFPVELPRESMAYAIRHTGVEAEVFAHGKAPLAFSWRCYTSRAYGLNKTECRHDCQRYPDGMELKTVDGKEVFTANGTSILSAQVYTLADFVEDLKGIGVKALRISPQYAGTDKVVEVFRGRINGAISAAEGLRELKAVHKEGLANGWYLGGAGKDYLTAVLG